MKHTRTRRARQAGFTLAEMMVVIVILGLLATLVVPNVIQRLSAAMGGKVKSDIMALENALTEYAVANGGRYPESLEALVTPDVNGHTFLKQTSIPKDPWKSEYQYEAPGPGQPRPRVFTLGKDLQPGGEGDDRDIDNLMILEGELDKCAGETREPRGEAVSASARERGARARGRAGFSMIEMLGVIVVLGLIATLVSVNWQAVLPRTELHTAVRELMETLQGTRSEAIARNAVHEVQYDLEQHRYRVVTPFRPGGGLAATPEERQAHAWRALPDSVRFRAVTIDGVEYVKGLVLVRFDAIGSASGHLIVLEQPELHNLYTIEVQGLLGLFSFHEGLFERPVPREDEFK
jgi:general secretion pathway protein G